MSEFDKVIGYDNIKNDLLQVCDMVKNPEIYKRLGAQIPRGILLSGDPGLGKTLLAKCFIKECGLKTFVIRRNRGTDDTSAKSPMLLKKQRTSMTEFTSFAPGNRIQ